MFAVVVIAAYVVAAPDEARAAPRLLVMDLKADGAVDADTAATLTDFLAAWVTESKKFSVTSKRELTALADLEAQRQEADCDDDVCIADLAGALGARYVVFGRVGQLGESWFVHVTLADAKGEVASDRRVVQAKTLEELTDKLHDAARQMTGAMALPKPAPTTTTPRLDGRPKKRLPEEPTTATAQARTGERKIKAAELRGDYDRLSLAGSGTMAGGFVLGAAGVGGSFALPDANKATLQPLLCGLGCGACAAGFGVGAWLWGQALDKKTVADELDPAGAGAN